jgi:hypothetical protein
MATRLELLAFDRAAPGGGGQDTQAATPQVHTTHAHIRVLTPSPWRHEGK